MAKVLEFQWRGDEVLHVHGELCDGHWCEGTRIQTHNPHPGACTKGTDPNVHPTTHSGGHAWRIPGTGEPGGLPQNQFNGGSIDFPANDAGATGHPHIQKQASACVFQLIQKFTQPGLQL